MQSTIELFRHLYKCIPPLFPEEVRVKMEHALSHLESDQTITLSEIEDTMVAFGYELWPWNQAYREFLAVAEGAVGEHFLLPKLSKAMQSKYADFIAYGGTLRDLHTGNAAQYFESEERGELCVALVEMQKELRTYTDREVAGISKVKYLRRVNEFKDILEEIRRTLQILRNLAEKEQDHPTLAGEIRERVKSFEYGLCLLGPELDYEAVCQSVDFFHGRKHELNRLRGIHVPKNVEFYS